MKNRAMPMMMFSTPITMNNGARNALGSMKLACPAYHGARIVISPKPKRARAIPSFFVAGFFGGGFSDNTFHLVL
jgi:hypothetical protein